MTTVVISISKKKKKSFYSFRLLSVEYKNLIFNQMENCFKENLHKTHDTLDPS